MSCFGENILICLLILFPECQEIVGGVFQACIPLCHHEWAATRPEYSCSFP